LGDHRGERGIVWGVRETAHCEVGAASAFAFRTVARRAVGLEQGGAIGCEGKRRTKKRKREFPHTVRYSTARGLAGGP
jgi:hypothetical protein